MATQLERRTATRRAVIDATRRIIQVDGAAGVTTDAIATAAGLSRTALYHYFESLEDVVAALYDDVSYRTVLQAGRETGGIADPLERLLAGCDAWLRRARRPAVRSVLLEAGPQILGWDRCREIEDRHSLRILTVAVNAATDDGTLDPPSPELLARVLNTVIGELALVRTDLADADATLAAIVDGFRSTSRRR